MSTVAEQLRTARQALQLEVRQVADTTKIKSDHIRALEEGDYGQFNAPVYIRGSVRTYAALLKLEVPKIMAALDVELGQTEKFAEPPSLTNQPKGALDWIMLQLSRINWRVAAGVFVLAALLIGGALAYHSWQQRKNNDPLKQLSPGLHQPGRAPGGDTLPLPAPSQK